jgi:hypothetical protein
MGLQKLDNSASPLVAPAATRKPFVAESPENDEVSIPDNLRPLSAEWISEELLLETRKLWSKAYNRVISIDEAIEILMNVKRVAEVLVSIRKEGHKL